jgi:hypothetical protein
MKNKMGVETKLEELRNHDWLYFTDKDDEVIFISDDETIREAAKLWKISPEAVKGLSDSLNNVVQCIVDTAIEDLRDTWAVADCAHNNALTAMQILTGDNDDDDGGDDNEPPEPNPDDCLECPHYIKETNTCNLSSNTD